MIQRFDTHHTPESLVRLVADQPGAILLRGGELRGGLGRYSLVTAWPFLTFRSWGARCELQCEDRHFVQYGDPWRTLGTLLARYETLDRIDSPFPLGGCFGAWGYDLKNFLEPRVGRRAVNDLGLPDCDLGFHDSLVVFDHVVGEAWVVSIGTLVDGSRSEERAHVQGERWAELLQREPAGEESCGPLRAVAGAIPGAEIRSSWSREAFLEAVQRAQAYIGAGDIYQVNLSHRLVRDWSASGWDLFGRLAEASPAPYAAWLHRGDYQLVSSSPELFLQLSGRQVVTQPIKGTRPRDPDPTRDAQLSYELQTSAKERAELLMITDLLRNDLGRVCEFGGVTVPDLMRLERYAQVQHLVSTVEGRLRPDVSHFQALATCFPGGSITGAPKIRAMQIIDELEPVSRGLYTGVLGYVGFNRESRLAVAIRIAVVTGGRAYFHAGAGIVADSDPVAEYQETLDKARAFLELAEEGRPRRFGGRVGLSGYTHGLV